MSSDSKFGSLPWIAKDEPDVYESCDLPESEQRVLNTATDDQVLPKEIELTNISAVDAQKRFQNCKVNAINADFTDGKVGYAGDCSEYQLFPKGERDGETITQRFQRLQAEVHQLMTDAEAVKKHIQSSDSVTSSGELTPDQLATLASSLNQQLTTLQLEDIFGSKADVDLTGQEIVLQKRLLEQISKFKPQTKSAQAKESEERITYELYSKPTASTDVKSEKMIELDRRLQRLEALLGKDDPGRLSALTADTMGHGLLEAANRLASRSALLQPGVLDQVEARLLTLQTRLTGITEKREMIADADAKQRIAELYELVKKWNSFSADLPQIVERLQDLQQLHEQASEFSSSLANLEFEQKHIDQNFSTYKTLLKQVQDSVADTLTTFKENVTVLESRIDAVSH